MPKLAPGQPAPDFELPNIDGSSVSLRSLLDGGAKGVAVLWLCNHCPYVIAYMGRLVALADEYRDIPFVAINSNDPATYPDDAADKMPAFAKQHRVGFPYLHDNTQQVARSYGVERTPEIFVLDPQGVCVYEGGVDDNWKDPDAVQHQPLRNALQSLREGRPVPEPQTQAMGCTIKWRKATATGG